MKSLADLNARLAEDDLTRRPAAHRVPAGHGGGRFRDEAPLLRPLPADGFDTGTALWPKADKFARISVGKCRYSVPARLIGKAVRIRLTANELTVFEGAEGGGGRTRGWSRPGTSTWCWTTTWRSWPASRARCPARCRWRRPAPTGRSPRRTRRCGPQARRKLGDGPGTRALIEVLLLHRRLPAASVTAGIEAALRPGPAPRTWSRCRPASTPPRRAAGGGAAGPAPRPVAGGGHHAAAPGRAAAGRPPAPAGRRRLRPAAAARAAARRREARHERAQG